MELQVWYSVPVAVHVDTEKGEVTRVVVIDEEIRRGFLDTKTLEWDVTLPDYSSPTEETLAIRIAETADWPAWENGY